jgi:hypothetical protein
MKSVPNLQVHIFFPTTCYEQGEEGRLVPDDGGCLKSSEEEITNTAFTLFITEQQVQKGMAFYAKEETSNEFYFRLQLTNNPRQVCTLQDLRAEALRLARAYLAQFPVLEVLVFTPDEMLLVQAPGIPF